MMKSGGTLLAVAALLALTGCSTPAPAAQPETLVVEPAALHVPTIRQGDYLTEVKKQLSTQNGMNDIQLLAAGYEACLRVTTSNKDAYRKKILAEAKDLESGLDQLVIAAGAKGLLCP